MKKIIILLINVSMLLICMTGCWGLTVPNPTPTPPSTTQSVYDKIDDLVDNDYSKIELDIVTATEFAELYSNYVLTQNNVIYSIEKLNFLPSDGNITDLPSNYKTTVTGYALIENGKVVELDGSKDVSIPSYDELHGHFNFDESNFKNVVLGKNSFEADVVSPSKFYGTDVDMNSLKVKVEYTKTSLITIVISYSTANATVQTVYVFED